LVTGTNDLANRSTTNTKTGSQGSTPSTVSRDRYFAHEAMKKFKEISRKIVSIKTFARRSSFLDDAEDKEEGIGLSMKRMKKTRDMLLVDVRRFVAV
jgi:hypothetical protein